MSQKATSKIDNMHFKLPNRPAKLDDKLVGGESDEEDISHDEEDGNKANKSHEQEDESSSSDSERPPLALTKSKNFHDLHNLTAEHFEYASASESSEPLSALTQTQVDLDSAINASAMLNVSGEANYKQQTLQQSRIPSQQQTNSRVIRKLSFTRPSKTALNLSNNIKPLNLDDQTSDPQNNLKIELLQNLLITERKKHDLRRKNNKTMRTFLERLQDDYLRLQQELVDAFELGHKIKARKDAQLEAAQQTIDEKEKTIAKLREQIAAVDDMRLRSEFDSLAEKQRKLFEIEREALKSQLKSLESQIVNERRNNSQLLSDFQHKFDEKALADDKEIASLRAKLATKETELLNLLNQPTNEALRELRAQNQFLSGKLEEYKHLFENCHVKYETIKQRLEMLIVENEQNDEKNYEELQKLQMLYTEQRRQVGQISLDLQDKEEALHMLTFSLNRSEQRAKNLLVALKGKEELHESLMSKQSAESSASIEKLSNELGEVRQQLSNCRSELNDKSNELTRLGLEHASQTELLKSSGDEQARLLESKLALLEQKLKSKEKVVAGCLLQSTKDCEKIDQLTSRLETSSSNVDKLSKKLSACVSDLNSKLDAIKSMEKKIASLEKINSENAEFKYQFDMSKTRESRLQSALEELRKEKEKLCMKLKLTETKLIKLNDSFSSEQAKIVGDYEYKIQTSRLNRLADERDMFKYKKYSSKLKRYCEHLREVHEHVCNPAKCGYLITNSKIHQYVNKVPKSGQRTCVGSCLTERASRGMRALSISSESPHSSPASTMAR